MAPILTAPTQQFSTLIARCTFAGLLLCCLLSGQTHAQTKPTDGSTPAALSAGAPAGAYGLGNLDNINLYNGSLNFRLPLLSIGGRGGAGHTIMLPIEQHWLVERYEDWQENVWNSAIPEREEELKPGYGPGIMALRVTGSAPQPCPTPFGNVQYDQLYRYTNTITRLSFTAPDGTETEFRDLVAGGQGRTGVCPAYTGADPNGFNRGQVFASVDGSEVTFIASGNVYDPVGTDAAPESHNISGTMLLRDGTRYVIGNGLVSSIRDRNGNQISFTYDGFSRVSVITDALNRQITIAYDVAEGGQYGTCDKITYKGFGGVDRVIRVSKTNLGSVLRAGYSLSSYFALFSLNDSPYTMFDPTVVAAVWLPDGTRKYQFQYNNYGELARVVLPTGGAFEYDFASGTTSNANGVVSMGYMNPQIYRRVVRRRVYPDGATLASRMSYSVPETDATPYYGVTTLGYVVVEERDGTGTQGTLLASSKHYFLGTGAANSLMGLNDDWQVGKESKTESYDVVNGAATTVLRQTENTWQVGPSFGNNGRVIETDTTLEPSGANLVSKQIFSYDQYNDKTDVYDYDFGTGAAGALIRRTHTDYLTTNSINGIAYDTVNPSTTAPDLTTTVHLRGLPVQTSIYDAVGIEQARTSYEYDNYTGTPPNHAALVARTGITGLDASFTTAKTTRGNATAVTRYLLTNGSVTGSINAYVQYDVAGNVVQSIDGLGNVAQVGYADSFYDGNNNRHTYAFPSSTTSPIPDPSGYRASSAAFGSSSVYDYWTGNSTSATDANGKMTMAQYNDVLDRLTLVTRPDGGRTQYIYNDVVGNLYLRTLTDQDATRTVEAYQFYDGLGRAVRSFLNVGGSPVRFSTTDTQYDALGRAWRMSNPYLTGGSGDPVNPSGVWLQTTFDALGRVTQAQTTVDGAQVLTAYSGNQVTATDQAGKMRRSVSDALGRLTSVYEDPNGFNYQTSYSYDVLGNLRTVTQDSQTRTFAYDSLGRLTAATNPESGTLTYQYDANGNVMQKTDARGVATNYLYDHLNRLKQTNYSDGTPYTLLTYDGATNGLGRFYANYESSTTGTLNFVTAYDAVGRPTERKTRFYVNGAGWTTDFISTREYDRAGHVTHETYPSGHAVGYRYDAAGRLGDDGVGYAFSGNLGNGVTRAYAWYVQYDAASRMTGERFETQTPLYHTLGYNGRGQLYIVQLGTGGFWNWNRGMLANHYGANDYTEWGTSGPNNNGNVLRSHYYVPNDDQLSGWAVNYQDYTYDSLNRLSSVTEIKDWNTGGGGYSYQQGYSYDRWGNRTINQGQTWGNGINNTPFSVDAATNRLTPGGAGTMTYDNAGNQTYDNYSTGTAAVKRLYDAENRMTETQTASYQPVSKYTYDAGGKRMRRETGGVVTWQVYGFEGELVAEYAASAAPTAPQKEYGYRNGELLITAAAAQVNVAAAANGATATAQNYTQDSVYPGAHYQPAYAIDGTRYVTPIGDHYWRDEHVLSSWLQIDFNGAKTISEVDVYTHADAPAYQTQADPTATQTFTTWGVTVFAVQYWTGSAWATVSGGNVTGNSLVRRQVTFPAVTTSKLRVVVNGAVDGVARIAEVEAYSTAGGSTADIEWLVSDQLGTPRMVADLSGSLAGIKRHDYLPFGEELYAGTGGRTTAQGYVGTADGKRQRWAQLERDTETGLDYAQARYYGAAMGRFVSPDPFSGSAQLTNPQSLNRYSYVQNQPTVFTDPSGLTMHAPVQATARLGGSGFADIPNYVAQDEARYEENLATTFAAIAEAHAIEEQLHAGTISIAQAASMVASNPNLAMVTTESSDVKDQVTFKEARLLAADTNRRADFNYLNNATLNVETKLGPQVFKGEPFTVEVTFGLPEHAKDCCHNDESGVSLSKDNKFKFDNKKGDNGYTFWERGITRGVDITLRLKDINTEARSRTVIINVYGIYQSGEAFSGVAHLRLIGDREK